MSVYIAHKTKAFLAGRKYSSAIIGCGKITSVHFCAHVHFSKGLHFNAPFAEAPLLFVLYKIQNLYRRIKSVRKSTWSLQVFKVPLFFSFKPIANDTKPKPKTRL